MARRMISPSLIPAVIIPSIDREFLEDSWRLRVIIDPGRFFVWCHSGERMHAPFVIPANAGIHESAGPIVPQYVIDFIPTILYCFNVSGRICLTAAPRFDSIADNPD